MSNRRPEDTDMDRCGNCRPDGTCMYIGPCMACAFERARVAKTSTKRIKPRVSP